MKAYQERWLSKLLSRKSDTPLVEVCFEIVDDDTGDTDPLIIYLASEILRLKEES